MRIRYSLLAFITVFVVGILLSPCFSQKIDFEVKTESYGGPVAPRHAAVIWIQTPDNKYVSTVEVWSYQYNYMLMNWRMVTGLVDTGEYDAITQATLPDHNDPIKIAWDCKDTSDNLVPHGTYEFCVEMTENEYWWKVQDPNEEYHGKYAKGTIVIDNSDKVAYGDTSDIAFSMFKATYDPTSGIVFHGQKPVHNELLSYWYNPAMQQVTIQLNPTYANSVVLHIINLKGEVIETVKMNPITREMCWDLRSKSGKKVPSGVYLFHVYSADRGNRISQMFSITLLK